MISYLSSGLGENDEFLPGEAMAEEISLSFSSDEDLSSVGKSNQLPGKRNVTGVAIRTDAMKLSNQLKRGSVGGMKV